MSISVFGIVFLHNQCHKHTDGTHHPIVKQFHLCNFGLCLMKYKKYHTLTVVSHLFNLYFTRSGSLHYGNMELYLTCVCKVTRWQTPFVFIKVQENRMKTTAVRNYTAEETCSLACLKQIAIYFFE